MTVQALDLGLMVPILMALAVAVLRRSQTGMVAAAAFAVTFFTMSAAIASMMVSAWLVTGDIAASLPPIVIFTIASLAGLLLAVEIFVSVTAEPQKTVSSAVQRLGHASVLESGKA
jgi:hypothetical protein